MSFPDQIYILKHLNARKMTSNLLKSGAMYRVIFVQALTMKIYQENVSTSSVKSEKAPFFLFDRNNHSTHRTQIEVLPSKLDENRRDTGTPD